MRRDVRIITPAASRDLTTLAAAKDELDITDGTWDTRLTRWIRDASEQIVEATNRPWMSETVEESFTFDWYDEALKAPLMLSRSPVTAFASLAIDSIAIADWDAYDYRLEAETGRLTLVHLSTGHNAIWPCAGSVVVTYTGGYTSIDDLPGGIEEACIQILDYRRSARGRDPALRSLSIDGGLESQAWTVPSGTVEAGGPLPADVMAKLALKRRNW